MEAKRALWVFIFVTIFVMINDRLLFVIFPTYLIHHNFSATQIGLIFSFGAILLVVVRTLIGKLSDKYGRKAILSVGLLLNSATTSIYPTISRLYDFATLKGLQEVSTTLKESVEDSIHADSFPSKERPKYLTVLGKVFPLARALAAVIGIIVTTYLSITYGFYIASVSMFIAFIIFFFFYKEDKIKIRFTKKIEVQRSRIYSYPKQIIYVAAIGFLTSFIYGIMYSPAFFILGEKFLGIHPAIIFLMLLVSYMASALVIHLAEKRTKNFGTRPILVISTLMFSIFSFMYAFSNLIFFFVALIGISITFYFWRMSYKTVSMELASPLERGEHLGFVKTMQGVGDVLGPIAGGILIDLYSIQLPFIAGGFLFIATFILILKTL